MLNPKEEAKFQELKDKCRELKVPAPPEIFIGLQVHDKNGVLVFDDKQRGHSWNRNFYVFMLAVASTAPGGGSNNFGAGYFSGRSLGGIGYSVTYSCGVGAGFVDGIGYVNTGANASYGILVGTGDTAFSADQYTLATLIAHGNAASQFAYNIMTAGDVPAYTAGTKVWKRTLSRVFNNNSGGSITVKEAGLMSKCAMFGNTAYYLHERSVLSPTVAVANAAQLTVTYEISMDFSAID